MAKVKLLLIIIALLGAIFYLRLNRKTFLPVFNGGILKVRGNLKAESGFFENGVPKIVHYTYASDMIPIQYKALIDCCINRNPDVKFILWTDAAAYRLVKKHFSDRLKVYESYLVKEPEKLKKTDIIRLMFVYQYGGIYMDLDNLCQKPLRDVMKQDSCIFTTDSDVNARMFNFYPDYMSNSFFACVKKHKFLKFVLDAVGINTHKNIFYTTGPFWLTDRYKDYKRKFLSSNATTDPSTVVTRGKYEIFCQSLLLDYLRSICQTEGNLHAQRKEACTQLNGYGKVHHTIVKHATIVHLSMNLGYSEFANRITQTFNMSTHYGDRVEVKGAL